jgi:hypothetical protein
MVSRGNPMPIVATSRTDETGGGNVRLSHHYHQRSLQRDPELERALEEGAGGTMESLQRGSLEESKESS